MSNQGREYLIIPQIVMEAIEKQLRREHGRKNMYENHVPSRELGKFKVEDVPDDWEVC